MIREDAIRTHPSRTNSGRKERRAWKAAPRNYYNQNVPINSETAENVCLLKETKQGCTDVSKEQWFLLLLTDI